MSLTNWRAQIDEMDLELLNLLNRRARLALQAGEQKTAAGLSLCDHKRERDVIERMCQINEGPLDDRAVVELYRVIIHESRRVQALIHREVPQPTAITPQKGQRRIAFQGAPGAFSEAAAVKLLGEEITLVPRPTFDSLFGAIDDGAADSLLAPIENSLAGFVHACFD